MGQNRQKCLSSWNLHSREERETVAELSKCYSIFESDKSSGEK